RSCRCLPEAAHRTSIRLQRDHSGQENRVELRGPAGDGDPYRSAGGARPSPDHAERRSGGNTLINNWAGSRPFEEWKTVVQLIEITPDKRVVWALRDWSTFGPASSTQLLDEPGVPENGDQQR